MPREQQSDVPAEVPATYCQPLGRGRVLSVLGGLAVASLVGLLIIKGLPKESGGSGESGVGSAAPASGKSSNRPARFVRFHNQSDPPDDARSVTVYWGDIPDSVRQQSAEPIAVSSNIHRDDYVGSDACRTCHKKNHQSWSQHPHRWMNAFADNVSVKGDFSGTSISYLGGEVTFYQADGEYRMQLKREHTRTYNVSQTLGSRFFQYYIGRQIDGPESAVSRDYQTDHVLPLGYWLEPEEWIPVVHIWGDERADGKRLDPFDSASYAREFTAYAGACNHCHTTFALGDLLSATKAKRMAFEVPVDLHWSASGFLADSLMAPPEAYSTDQFLDLLMERDFLEAPDHAVALGVSCEACHLGCKEHVDNPRVLPRFFPHSPHLVVEDGGEAIDPGRTHKNVNWACGRCHSGVRPQLAAGMSTWNSTEYTDAMRGSCYSELKCVDCHNPHQAIGQTWPRSAHENDALCIRCHQKLSEPDALTAHSHHAADSAGSRCMNCHMPRLNEGMQDVVRTHMIFSPTNAPMIEANQPNACNQCHTQEPIDWTLKYLSDWYGRDYSPAAITSGYPDREQPTALGWLASDHESVRLIAADSLIRTNSRWAIKELVRSLDDPSS